MPSPSDTPGIKRKQKDNKDLGIVIRDVACRLADRTRPPYSRTIARTDGDKTYSVNVSLDM